MSLTENEKKKYAYYQLVTGDNDFTGMVAYSLYKNAKIEYVEEYYSDKGVYPDDEQLKDFQLKQCGKTTISSYRKYAEELITAFVNECMNINNKELLKKLLEIEKREKKIKQKEQHLKDSVKKQSGFWNGVLQSFVASIIFLLITVIVIVSTKLPSNYAESIVDKVIEIIAEKNQ